MQVIIMAGGQGSRLLPLTEHQPKALLPIGATPLIGTLLDRLAAAGMTEAVISLGHMGGAIRDALGGQWRGIPLRYQTESEPMGTAGALTLIAGLQPDFIVVNCDLLTDFDFRAFLAAHRLSGAAATLAAGEWVERLRFGVVTATEDGRLLTLREKPEMRHDILLGIYALNAAALGRVLAGPARRIDMPDLIQTLRDGGFDLRVHRSAARWIDVGTPQDLARALSGDPFWRV